MDNRCEMLPTLTKRHWRLFLMAAFAVGVLVYGRMLGQDFVSYDDRLFIHINMHVLSGLTLDNFLWSFRIDTPSMWHPLTWLSYQLNAQISLWQGQVETIPVAWPFKLTNLLLHLLSTWLLFKAMHGLTANRAAATVIACLFLLHPANVESVAWVAERKNALSQVFLMASLWSYSVYAHKREWRWLAVTCVIFMTGLLSKPAILTLPVVFLLLDFWPLCRSKWQGGPDSLFRLVGEKLPLFMLSAADAAITFINGRLINVVVPLENVTMLDRVMLLPVTYARYLFHYLCPVTVGPMQTPHDWNILQILACTLLLLVITAICIHQYKHRLYLLVGWLWFIGTLFPMAGFIKTSEESMADRHLYYPGLGLLLMVVFLTADLVGRRRWLLPAGVCLLLVFSVLTFRQVRVWDNSYTLYSHAIAQSDNNVWAHNNLGSLYWLEGDFLAAQQQFELALAIDPDYKPAVENMQAVRQLLDAPNPLGARVAFARHTLTQGRFDYAESQLRILQLMTSDPLVTAMRAEVALRQNQTGLARELIAQAVAQADVYSAAGARQIARVYDALGQEEQSRVWLSKASELQGRQEEPSVPSPDTSTDTSTDTSPEL